LQLLSRKKITRNHQDKLAKWDGHTDVPRLLGENERVKELVRQLLIELGEDPKREGLRRTPKRVDLALRFLTAGYHQDIDQILNGALFKEKYNEMVIVKDIDFYSLCEHHLLPFYGKCHVAYIPNGWVVGLSKIPRIVDVFARRLQLQERMTTQIAQTLMEVLKPAGVAVVTEARHLCMMMRGVQKQNTVVTNSAVLGVFHDDRACREEFMQLIGHRQMG
jgi:GTP cyclohydrolase I